MSQHHLTTHAHNGATDESSGTCAPHRFTAKRHQTKSFAGPVPVAPSMARKIHNNVLIMAESARVKYNEH